MTVQSGGSLGKYSHPKEPEERKTSLHLAIERASAYISKTLKQKKPQKVLFDLQEAAAVPKIVFP